MRLSSPAGLSFLIAAGAARAGLAAGDPLLDHVRAAAGRFADVEPATMGIAQSLYYVWSKEFMEARKRRLAGDAACPATTDEVRDLRRETGALEEAVADLMRPARE